MYSAHAAQESCAYQGYYSSGALADTTNLISAPLPNPNGDSRKQQYYSSGNASQQPHSPAPYPPLPPAAPAALDPFCLPLPPQQFAQPCYNYSTPPAPAPYPPLPRAEAIAPASLNGAYGQAAVDVPLPPPRAPVLPQLVADYPSPEAAMQALQRRSMSPPPPPRQPHPQPTFGAPVLGQLATEYHSTSPPAPPSQPPADEHWLPSPPPPQWWQGPPGPPASVMLPFRGGTEEAASPAPPPQQHLESSANSSKAAGSSGGESFSGNSAGSDGRRKKKLQARQQRAAPSRKDGVEGHYTPAVEGHYTPAVGTRPRDPRKAKSHRAGAVGSSSSSNDAYVIPKKSSRGQGSYTIPKKTGGTSPDHPKLVYSKSELRKYGEAQPSSERTPPRESPADDFRRCDASGGRVGGGERRSEKDERRRDNNSNRDGRNGRDNDRRYASGGGDKKDSFRRQARDDGAGRRSNDGSGRHGRSREHEENNRRGSGRDRQRQRTGKSCPPPSAEKRRDANAGVRGTAALMSPEQERDDEIAELASQLTALELDAGKESVAEEGKEKAADGGDAGKGKPYLSLEEYKEATAAGEIKPYKGTKYKTVDDRYADGWAYNPTTRRWIKVACQEKKDAIEALPALLARLELMESRDKLATQRSQLLETKVEEIKKKKDTVSLAMPTAPVLVAFDTNWLIHRLADTMCRVSDIAGRQNDTSVLIPKAVLTELDRLKTRGRDEATRSSAQKANRYFRGLVEKPLERGREFPVVRVQEDTELFRDNGHHSRPEGLGGDDSILNCCMFFTQGIDTPRKVTLVTGDNNFAIRASANGLATTGRPQCDPGHCRMPLCPAPPRPSPFSRGY
ncbi:unnamed protein product [Ectocarpus fasciculatus]